MKNFEKPEIDVKIIDVEDVITTSCTDDDWAGEGCENQTGWN